jgi:hypothetical protein
MDDIVEKAIYAHSNIKNKIENKKLIVKNAVNSYMEIQFGGGVVK